RAAGRQPEQIAAAAPRLLRALPETAAPDAVAALACAGTGEWRCRDCWDRSRNPAERYCNRAAADSLGRARNRPSEPQPRRRPLKLGRKTEPLTPQRRAFCHSGAALIGRLLAPG